MTEKKDFTVYDCEVLCISTILFCDRLFCFFFLWLLRLFHLDLLQYKRIINM